MRRERFDEASARSILLVRAIEEIDGEERLLPVAARVRASRQALEQAGSSPAAVRLRARLVLDGLAERFPALARLAGASSRGPGTAGLLLGLAFLAGLMTNAIGLQRQVNLLSFPLLGLLGWNLLIYLGLLVLPLLRGRREGAVTRLLSGHLLDRTVRRWLPAAGAGPGATAVLADALLRFGAGWRRAAGGLMAARLRRTFHLAAIALIAGVVAGMYVRGLVFEYRVVWESTWLDASQVQALLGTLLAPAAWLLGMEVPPVAPLQAPGGGDAAAWIHLHAATALLLVGLPRGAMALHQAGRARWLARGIGLDLEDPYYRRLFAAWRGAAHRIRILPYSYTPSRTASVRLKTLLLDHFGARADLRQEEPLPYGAEEIPSAVGGEAEGTVCLAVLFNLAQPPESEVHGLFLEQLTHRLDREHHRLLVVLDVSPYRERIGDPERIRQRIGAWERVVREAGLAAMRLDPEADGTGGASPEAAGQGPGALSGSLWPDHRAAPRAG